VIHEAGHLFFSWFGEFIGVIGGTVGQLFVPVAFTVYFFIQREFFSRHLRIKYAGAIHLLKLISDTLSAPFDIPVENLLGSLHIIL
jgi:hypothetical protein